MKRIILLTALFCLGLTLNLMSQNVGINTQQPLNNLHVNGIPTAVLNGNANAVAVFGHPLFPGCLGRFGRFCRLDPVTLLPDGRYDLIRYMNTKYNPLLGQFEQIDPDFDVWIDGPCIANNPELTGFDIAYCPPGATGAINPLSRLRINGIGNMGLGTTNPLGNLHVNGIPTTLLNNNANATMLFGPPQFPGCLGRFGRFCRLGPNGLPDGRYDLIRYMNLRYNPVLGQFNQVDANFDAWIDGPCIANDPALTGFDIAYCAAGTTGPVNPLSRLRINGLGNMGLGTTNPLGNLHVNGIPQAALNDNANATMLFGPPQFPGCLGRFGRFCRLGPTGLPDGRYDLIRYMNAQYVGGQFQQVDPDFDVWIDGPCIANNPALTGFDIAYCPAGGQAGQPINPLSRMRINGLGNMGLGTTNPLGNLHVNGIPQATLNNNANATMLFGPPQFPGCLGRMGRFCRLGPNGLPDGRYDLIRYMNAQFNEDAGHFEQVDPDFDVWVDGPCIAHVDSAGQTGFDIGYCPPGQVGPLNPLTRLRINGVGNVGLGTPNPLGNLHVNGIPQAVLNNNANATVLFGPPQFPGCLGRMGRFCRLTGGVPDGRYDLIRYLNATFDGEQFKRVDPNFDVWVEGPCIANTAGLSGYDIGHAPADALGQPGDPITPESFMRIRAGGNIGISEVNPEFRLHVNGQAAAIEFIPLSDLSMKKNIQDLSGSLEKVKALRGITFEFIQDEEMNCPEGTRIGYIAQELQAIIPEVVVEKEDSYLRVNYSAIIPVLSEAITEQQEIIEAQSDKITDLRAEVEELRDMLKTHAELEDRLDRMTDDRAKMMEDVAILKAAILTSPEK